MCGTMCPRTQQPACWTQAQEWIGAWAGVLRPFVRCSWSGLSVLLHCACSSWVNPMCCAPWRPAHQHINLPAQTASASCSRGSACMALPCGWIRCVLAPFSAFAWRLCLSCGESDLVVRFPRACWACTCERMAATVAASGTVPLCTPWSLRPACRCISGAVATSCGASTAVQSFHDVACAEHSESVITVDGVRVLIGCGMGGMHACTVQRMPVANLGPGPSPAAADRIGILFECSWPVGVASTADMCAPTCMQVQRVGREGAFW